MNKRQRKKQAKKQAEQLQDSPTFAEAWRDFGSTLQKTAEEIVVFVRTAAEKFRVLIERTVEERPEEVRAAILEQAGPISPLQLEIIKKCDQVIEKRGNA